MTGRVEFIVNGDCGELTPNRTIRMHWGLIRSWKQAWKLEARNAIRAAHVPAFAGKVTLSFIVRRARKLDPDNIRSSLVLKALVDSLVDEGIIGGDSEAYVICGPVIQETGKAWKMKPHIVVIVEDGDG